MDILEFSRNPKHVSPGFPEAIGEDARTAGCAAWEKSVQGFQHDLQEND